MDYDILIDKTQNPIKLYKVYNGKYVEIHKINEINTKNKMGSLNVPILILFFIVVYYSNEYLLKISFV